MAKPDTPESVLATAKELKGKNVKLILGRPNWAFTGILVDFRKDGSVFLRPDGGHSQWFWPLAIEEVRDA